MLEAAGTGVNPEIIDAPIHSECGNTHDLGVSGVTSGSEAGGAGIQGWFSKSLFSRLGTPCPVSDINSQCDVGCHSALSAMASSSATRAGCCGTQKK